MPHFELPDAITSLPAAAFQFSPGAREEGSALASAHPETIFRRLLRDQETEVVFLLARRVLAAFVPATGAAPGPGAGAREIMTMVASARESLIPRVRALSLLAEPQVRRRVLQQRAAVSLTAGCWLDTVSQAATQPNIAVNRLFSHHFVLLGEGTEHRSLHQIRRRALDTAGAYVPEIDAADFLATVGAHPLTALHGAFYLSLSRLAASFLPEVAGVHYAFFALGVDDALTGVQSPLTERMLQEGLEEYLTLAGASDGTRLRAAADLVIRLESEHVALLEAVASRLAQRPLDAMVAEIIARHSRYGGAYHHDVKVGDSTLAELMGSGDPWKVMRGLRHSRLLRAKGDGQSRFVRATKFGGPMFGVFDEQEAALLHRWAELAEPPASQEEPDIHARQAAADAAAWRDRIARSEPDDVVFAAQGSVTHREMLYRLVNIEHFPGTLPAARRHALRCLEQAEILFTHGARGKFTDSSYFDYAPESLTRRLEQIYWDKMGECKALSEIPDRDTVVFGQKLSALGNLIDGTWAHRIGNLGRFQRASDRMLFAIYADEMGRGDLRKNHITVIHQVLSSLGIRLPHIRDAEFIDQDELLDEVYDYSVFQLCLSLFPDSLYNEILGYNLGIEMFGLGDVRLHEMQRLRRYGFDDSYERLHLSIDNFSAGHARQSANIIISYLDDIQRRFGDLAVQREWRRIWRGYASFAYFMENELVRSLDIDLVI